MDSENKSSQESNKENNCLEQKEPRNGESAENQEQDYARLLENCNKFLGRRVECQGFYGTIKYSGPLHHEGMPANSDKQLWFGIEWDDETRGRHNGTVKDVVYFSTTENKNSGTLVKYEKVNLGIDILDGILVKYYKENIPVNLKKQIEEMATQRFARQSKEKQSNDEIEQEQKEIEKFEAKSDDETKKKVIQVEIDEEAYFETFKKHKKMVEFYGFDKIWNKLNTLYELNEISLQEVNLSDLGAELYLRKLLPKLKILSMEKNLLFDWEQIFQIGYELQHLQSLSITSNYFKNPNVYTDKKSIHCWSTHTEIPMSPVGVFSQLKSLVLIDCKLNWKNVCSILPAFPVLQELFLCHNDMRDFENIKLRDEDLKNLSLLNLENTSLETIEGLKQHLVAIPNLQRLILNKNKLTSLGKIEKLDGITHISLESNLIENPIIFTELSQFPNLVYLNVKHNPVGDKYGRSYVRQRAVAECPKLSIINGSNLKKYERKDCEIYYLRKTFDDFFAMTGQVYYKYDLKQFLDWAHTEHPNHTKLLQKYGNPYEQQADEPQNITEDQAPKNIMIELTLVAAAGPQLGKPDKVKKFPDNTNILSLKNVLSKLYGIPNDQLVLYYKVSSHDPNEILDEDHKTLAFYGIKQNNIIIIDQKA